MIGRNLLIDDMVGIIDNDLSIHYIKIIGPRKGNIDAVMFLGGMSDSECFECICGCATFHNNIWDDVSDGKTFRYHYMCTECGNIYKREGKLYSFGKE